MKLRSSKMSIVGVPSSRVVNPSEELRPPSASSGRSRGGSSVSFGEVEVFVFTAGSEGDSAAARLGKVANAVVGRSSSIASELSELGKFPKTSAATAVAFTSPRALSDASTSSVGMDGYPTVFSPVPRPHTPPPFAMTNEKGSKIEYPADDGIRLAEVTTPYIERYIAEGRLMAVLLKVEMIVDPEKRLVWEEKIIQKAIMLASEGAEKNKELAVSAIQRAIKLIEKIAQPEKRIPWYMKLAEMAFAVPRSNQISAPLDRAAEMEGWTAINNAFKDLEALEQACNAVKLELNNLDGALKQKTGRESEFAVKQLQQKVSALQKLSSSLTEYYARLNREVLDLFSKYEAR